MPSPANETKKPAAAAASDADATSAPNFNEPNKRRRLDDALDKKPSADPHSDLNDALKDEARALADIAAAQKRLGASRARIEKARHDIRSKGEAEFDSLLVIGKDSITHLLSFFGVKDLCRAERVCSSFKRQASEVWADHDEKAGPNKSVCDSPKMRALRLYRAPSYAKMMEKLAHKHRFDDYCSLVDEAERAREEGWRGGWGVNSIDNSRCCDDLKDNIRGWGRDRKCKFADKLANIAESNEIYLRISRKNKKSPNVLFQGFCPLKKKDGIFYLNFRDVSFPAWPEMQRLISLETKNWKSEEEGVIDSVCKNTTVTLISFSETNKPLLVASVDHFRKDPYNDAREWWFSKIEANTPTDPHDDCPDMSSVPFRGVLVGWSKDAQKDVFGLAIIGGGCSM